MDAVEFFKTQERMCDFLSNGSLCIGCPFHGLVNRDIPCARWCFVNPEKAVALVEQWGSEHPAKTRQSEFLKQWPDTRVNGDGVLSLCPNEIYQWRRAEDGTCAETMSCDDCRREFWMKEVE